MKCFIYLHVNLLKKLASSGFVVLLSKLGEFHIAVFTVGRVNTEYKTSLRMI